ncbi:unnamed protein product [Zymoseptoria tritici ST99CH_3D7]|uniref:Mannan endo-1,6-alpha-mannosidase n=1 Tax=Zymoseptoria tritici (strain ST99CH_3D7) TaxID=1276538 RepID=A0A1X7RF98_ZYMT9|nr:unnamed protein product [Zymoseptoria tritici ST99CH_3D7]
MRPRLLLAALLGSVQAIELDVDDPESIKAAAKTVAWDLVDWYSGNETGQSPGMLPDPYYWWAAGAMFGSLIDYWYYTGDDTYNEITTQGITFQVGPNRDFMEPNHTKSLGNDDQAFWALTAMTAAEVNFPNPPEDQPQWLALAQGVFNTQYPRWNTETCGGGLKWQIFAFNNGYSYKNSITNGCFFNLAARLGMYTGNTTYLEWAARAYDWTFNVGLIDNSNFGVYDGSDDTLNCTDYNHIQWSYNVGVYLLGTAVMWNQTEGEEQAKWERHARGLLEAAQRTFFYEDSQIMFEVACEPSANCNVDQTSFKAYLSRWMTASTKVAPWMYEIVMPLMRTSAQAAAAQCTGGETGTKCGTRWYEGGYDGTYGVGQQMNALEVIQSNLIDQVLGPLGNGTGGTSVGDINAGGRGYSAGGDNYGGTITTADRAGAGILTALVLAMFVGGGYWMIR